MSDARAVLNGEINEAALQKEVIRTAKRFGWEVYHTWNSQHSEAGFPDLVLAHSDLKQVIFAELKTEKGEPSEPQWHWYATLLDIASNRAPGYRPAVQVFVWRPSDLSSGRIDQILSGQS